MPRSNPFATRFIRPGEIPFFFPPGLSAPQLIERLRAANWQGQIVGPHGSGKSTLIEVLLPLFADAGRKVVRYQLHLGERRIATLAADARGWNVQTQVVVDGYEQLGLWARWKLSRLVRKHSAGLLVTTHHSVGLPTLYETGTSETLALDIVHHLTSLSNSAAVTDAEVRQVFTQHHGNLRDTLLALYDLAEARGSS